MQKRPPIHLIGHSDTFSPDALGDCLAPHFAWPETWRNAVSPCAEDIIHRRDQLGEALMDSIEALERLKALTDLAVTHDNLPVVACGDSISSYALWCSAAGVTQHNNVQWLVLSPGTPTSLQRCASSWSHEALRGAWAGDDETRWQRAIPCVYYALNEERAYASKHVDALLAGEAEPLDGLPKHDEDTRWGVTFACNHLVSGELAEDVMADVVNWMRSCPRLIACELINFNHLQEGDLRIAEMMREGLRSSEQI